MGFLQRLPIPRPEMALGVPAHTVQTYSFKAWQATPPTE